MVTALADRSVGTRRARRSKRPPARFGYQPGLDGLRAISVIAVISYHAGFTWMHGGWIGVEVFFVISGFLITSLLIDECDPSGQTSLRTFWLRRARRLLPALVVVLATVALVALVIGSDAQRAELRRDIPWALGYLGNWGQIVGDVPYYAGDPPLLRHLWSLAIEEQFYLVWPLAFVALMRSRLRHSTVARLLAGLALAAMVTTFWLNTGRPSLVDAFGGVDRVNFMYLSTFTRASGLLLGAAAAFIWRPWRHPTQTGTRRSAGPGRVLDAAGALAVGGLVCIAVTATLTEGYVYAWLLPLVSMLALVAALVVVHPAAAGMRALLGWVPLVAIGRRSYGLYLWHWPMFVFTGATHGSGRRVAAALALTAVASELTYRHVELPIRRRGLGGWWRSLGPARDRAALAAAVVATVVVACYAAVGPYDRARGGRQAEFAAPTVATSEATARGATPRSTPGRAAGPRRLAIVGDSQAHSLAINLPDGIESTFAVTDGSIAGCSIYDAGGARSALADVRIDFAACEDWQQEWASAVESADADIALVVLGAWDVFDLEMADGARLEFGSPAWDEHVVGNLRSGLDALVATGARVALLEVACMRPVTIEGAGLPALPERGADDRVAHVNELLRNVAGSSNGAVTFIEGPDSWCGDEAAATDLALRWDGVHLYEPGAQLVYETIAAALLEL